MRGGKREGSGRKNVNPEWKKQPFCTKLKPDLIEWLKEKDNTAAFLDQILRREMHKEDDEAIKRGGQG